MMSKEAFCETFILSHLFSPFYLCIIKAFVLKSKSFINFLPNLHWNTKAKSDLAFRVSRGQQMSGGEALAACLSMVSKHKRLQLRLRHWPYFKLLNLSVFVFVYLYLCLYFNLHLYLYSCLNLYLYLCL